MNYSRGGLKQLNILQNRFSLLNNKKLLTTTTVLASRSMSSLNNTNRRLLQTKNWLSTSNNNYRKMSTASNSVSGVDAAQAEILTKSNLAVREIILNRPKKFNALNLSMVKAITPQLQAWENSDLAKIILLKSSGGKGFCAGGDVKTVVDLAEKGEFSTATKFFEEEYQLDHLIATMDTPFVAIMDGITMGGGVGLSVHAPFRIATENTLFAMPETGIGFLPEVGGSFFLSRLDGQLGTYLGLTGKRLKGLDVLYAGIATHYVPSSRLSALESRLSELENATHDMVNDAIEEFSDEITQPFSLAGETRKAIDRCFKYDTISEIMNQLQQEPDSEWKQDTLKLMNAVSPTSLKVTLQQLRYGASLSLGQCFKMEYHLVQKFLQGHDFKEGVNATLVTRSKPQWNPANLDSVDDTQIKETYFNAPSPSRLELLSSRDFKHYPHRKYMLPSEQDIKRVVTGEAVEVGNYALTRNQVITHFKHKHGLLQKLNDVMDRKTIEKDQILKWIY
ncbi:ClpP/crotonase-like domain-containing protein [Cokeromyces recurvatus]|uniref:ClpP/crotonase-like domain-containing protein n=1 Tax=Cokeromyces recurvatus TaxID=90255 RepID=UPI00221F5E23|nr:ClpP/crotonase-like domain-containing protein [Cokeromyces recurvatus]KAI7902948.1 ClpP/crotonase-like domain-containing protein [Cokeromyces recurvatus]